VDQLLATGDRGDVDRQRDTLTAMFGGELLGSGLAGPGLARGDVDLGSTVLRNPAAIILPIPREPPVTSATRP